MKLLNRKGFRMMLDDVEILCHEYICLIKDIEHFKCGTASPICLYGLDNQRIELHQKICDLLRRNKDDTLEITGKLDEISYDGTELYLKLTSKSLEGVSDE